MTDTREQYLEGLSAEYRAIAEAESNPEMATYFSTQHEKISKVLQPSGPVDLSSIGQERHELRKSKTSQPEPSNQPLDFNGGSRDSRQVVEVLQVSQYPQRDLLQPVFLRPDNLWVPVTLVHEYANAQSDSNIHLSFLSIFAGVGVAEIINLISSIGVQGAEGILKLHLLASVFSFLFVTLFGYLTFRSNDRVGRIRKEIDIKDNQCVMDAKGRLVKFDSDTEN